jgi:CBS domain-containing protein
MHTKEGERGMKVRDIMTYPIITEDEEVPVIKIARDMNDLDIGSVVITKEGKPVGIITERNIASRVLLKDKRPSEVKAKEIMSFPLATISPDEPVEEACKLAAKSNIRRLPVVENGVPIGIVTMRNILTLKPECIRRIYPRVRVLASGWTLDRLEKSFSECEGFLVRRNRKGCKRKLKEVYEELSDLASYYVDDRELMDIFTSLKQLYQDFEAESETEEGISLEDLRKRVENILRKFRHTTYWRKQQSISDLGSGRFWFRDFRYGRRKEDRVPYRRTRTL